MSAQPALFNDAPGARRKSAASWSPDENQFADLIIAAWNKAFADLAGGYRVYNVRHNRGLAVRFYRRNCERPEAERFTSDDVCAAINAYAACPVNVKLQSWKRFADWLRDAEENIDHQLRRIGRPVGKTDGRYAAAVRVVENLGVGSFAKQASQLSTSISEHLRYSVATIDRMRHPRAADKATRAACIRLLALAARYKALAKPDRDALRERADTAFTALNGRFPTESGEDCTLCRAIILSLMDFDARRAVASRSKEDQHP